MFLLRTGWLNSCIYLHISYTGSSRERTRASGKKANKSLTKKAAVSKEVTSSSPHNEVTEGEEEYEVEAIRAHQWVSSFNN